MSVQCTSATFLHRPPLSADEHERTPADHPDIHQMMPANYHTTFYTSRQVSVLHMPNALHTGHPSTVRGTNATDLALPPSRLRRSQSPSACRARPFDARCDPLFPLAWQALEALEQCRFRKVVDTRYLTNPYAVIQPDHVF